MTKRVFNFSAGPAMLPLEVLEASARALIDYQGKGFGIAECSHRGKEFDAVLDEAIARCRLLTERAMSAVVGLEAGEALAGIAERILEDCDLAVA